MTKVNLAPPPETPEDAFFPQVLTWLLNPKTLYVGPAIPQFPGAWTRVGPTWLLPDGLWCCLGPGVAEWGTTAGLAELATSDVPRPEFHGWGPSVERANVVFLITKKAQRLLTTIAPYLAVADLIEQRRKC